MKMASYQYSYLSEMTRVGCSILLVGESELGTPQFASVVFCGLLFLPNPQDLSMLLCCLQMFRRMGPLVKNYS